MERCNARNLSPDMVPIAADLAVIDVSFISLAKVLGAVLGCLAVEHDVLALVKPQFEVGRGRVGKGGVVRSAELRQEALVSVGEAAVALGEGVFGLYPSGLPGPKGNRESFIWLAEAARPGAVSDNAGLAAMAAAAELAFDDMIAGGQR
jgi:23S rRNA (cytidine1920-2'-O)/16S rRNA (cytidine1409-2'-O)-methyltransferase